MIEQSIQYEDVEYLRFRVKELEDENADLRRLASIGATMTGLAHSVRSALGLCRAATFMVERALNQGDPEEIRRAWGMVKRSSSRTAELVAQLLDPEEAQRLRLGIGDPDAVVREICEVVVEQAADQDDKLELELEGSLSGAVFDHQALRRCCIELIANALDALAERRDSGTVTVKTEGEPDGWRLIVCDDGPGIPPENMKKVLAGGYSTKGKGGTGLGLIQVRQLVRKHGGKVEVLSTPGQGTAVTCWFPRIKPSIEMKKAHQNKESSQ